MTRFTPERTFLAGKIVFNFGQPSRDCVVRRMSGQGTTPGLETEVNLLARALRLRLDVASVMKI